MCVVLSVNRFFLVQCLQVPLDGVGHVMVVVQVTSELHFAARIRRGDLGHTCRTYLVGLLVSEMIGRLGLEDGVETGRTAAEAGLVDLDDVVAGCPSSPCGGGPWRSRTRVICATPSE